MTTSRSTPRLRLTALLLAAVLLLVAVAEKPLSTGAAAALLPWLGFVLVVLAALGRVWASSFIAGRKDRDLVTAGPYARCRNPLYAFSWLAMVGIGFASRSISLTITLAIVFAWLYARAARHEETFLAETHGAAFRRYAATTPAFLPRATAPVLPGTWTIHPAVFAKAFVDAASLLGFFALVRIADLAQQAGWLPTLLRLP
jgi:protein-S-isoprenylcysteine O-methyltransferase Ste14